MATVHPHSQLSFAENGRQQGGTGFSGQLWSGALGLGNSHAVWLSAGTQQSNILGLGVRVLEVGEIVLVMYRLERKTERRAQRRQ